MKLFNVNNRGAAKTLKQTLKILVQKRYKYNLMIAK